MELTEDEIRELDALVDRYVLPVFQRLAVLAVACNVLATALVLWPWLKRRETFSGLMGRWYETELGAKRRIAERVVPFVDWLVWWERRHCIRTYRQERDCREILYGERE